MIFWAMKYILIISLLILSCSSNESSDFNIKSKQIYDDCFKVSSKMFKEIPQSEINNLSVDQLCDEDTSFYEKKLDEVCLQACIEAYKSVKNK